MLITNTTLRLLFGITVESGMNGKKSLVIGVGNVKHSVNGIAFFIQVVNVTFKPFTTG